MKIITKDTSKDNINDKFLREKNNLKNMIYSEIECIEKRGTNNTVCSSLDMLKDALFVIDRGFEDITRNINKFNLKEREAKLQQFKESLQYIIYGK